jgi:hypothetical protein
MEYFSVDLLRSNHPRCVRSIIPAVVHEKKSMARAVGGKLCRRRAGSRRILPVHLGRCIRSYDIVLEHTFIRRRISTFPHPDISFSGIISHAARRSTRGTHDARFFRFGMA